MPEPETFEPSRWRSSVSPNLVIDKVPQRSGPDRYAVRELSLGTAASDEMVSGRTNRPTAAEHRSGSTRIASTRSNKP